MEMYEQKFGAARTKQMIPMMRQTGEACTPPIRFSYGGMTANSLDGHRLMELAWEQGGWLFMQRWCESMPQSPQQ